MQLLIGRCLLKLISSLLSNLKFRRATKEVSYIQDAAKCIFKSLNKRVHTYKLSTILHTPVVGYDSPGLLKSHEMHPGTETCSGKDLT